MADDGRGEQGAGRPPWAGVELAAVGLLCVVGVLALGGLASGIDVASSQQLPLGDSLTAAWNAVTFGASWATPFPAALLLAAIGLCWWQADRWSDEDEDQTVAPAYIDRATQVVRWALASLVVTLLGAIADVTAVIGLNVRAHAMQIAWARVIGTITEAIAVSIIAVVGGVLALRTGRDR